MGQQSSEIREEIEQTRQQMGETVEAIGHRANVTGRMKEKVTGTASSLKEKITGEAAAGAKEVKDTAEHAVGIAQKNPIGLALGSIAAGLLAGLAIPSTKTESQHIGPLVDRIEDRAKEAGREALVEGGVGAAKGVASAVVGAGKGESSS